MHEPNRQAEQHQSNTNPQQPEFPSESTSIVDPDLNKETGKKEKYNSNPKNNVAPHSGFWTRFFKDITFTGCITAIATLTIAGATIIYTHYAREQWKVMSGTLNEIKTSGTTSKNQINNMISETNRIANSMEAANTQYKKSVEDSLAQSKAVLDANIKAAELDQRAWVGIIGIIKVTPTTLEDVSDKPVYIKEGSPATFKVRLTNSGKSPALKVKVIIRFKTFPANKKFSPDYGDYSGEQSVVVIQPQGYFNLPTEPSQTVTTSHIDAIKSGKNIPYLFGIITYEDIFKRLHQTTFCMYLAPSLNEFFSCDTYNTAD